MDKKISQMTEEEKIKEEKKIKKEELKKKIERLGQIPQEKEKFRGFLVDKLEKAKLELELLKPQLEFPKVITPYFEFENKPLWTELRKKDISFKIKMKEKEIEAIKKEEGKVVRTLNEQESRIKEDIPRLKARLKELGVNIKKLTDLQTKPNYIG